MAIKKIKTVTKSLPEKVNVHYVKNSEYRQIHVDGALGGITPKGKININFYAERLVIPKAEECDVTADGKLGKRMSVSPDSKDGIIREIEFGTYMDLETAKSLKTWLDLKIQQLESVK